MTADTPRSVGSRVVSSAQGRQSCLWGTIGRLQCQLTREMGDPAARTVQHDHTSNERLAETGRQRNKTVVRKTSADDLVLVISLRVVRGVEVVLNRRLVEVVPLRLIRLVYVVNSCNITSNSLISTSGCGSRPNGSSSSSSNSSSSSSSRDLPFFLALSTSIRRPLAANAVRSHRFPFVYIASRRKFKCVCKPPLKLREKVRPNDRVPGNRGGNRFPLLAFALAFADNQLPPLVPLVPLVPLLAWAPVATSSICASAASSSPMSSKSSEEGTTTGRSSRTPRAMARRDGPAAGSARDTAPEAAFAGRGGRNGGLAGLIAAVATRAAGTIVRVCDACEVLLPLLVFPCCCAGSARAVPLLLADAAARVAMSSTCCRNDSSTGNSSKSYSSSDMVDRIGLLQDPRVG